MPPDRRNTAGFTLIEALVALVLLSTGLIAFHEFLGSAFISAERVRQAASEYDCGQNALALASTLNPMAAPQGSFDAGTYHIRWRARRLGDVRQSRGYPSGRGRFQTALYRVVLDFPELPQFAAIEVTKLGYHLITSPGAAPGNVLNTEPE